jgi:hypothetical protein
MRYIKTPIIIIILNYNRFSMIFQRQYGIWHGKFWHYSFTLMNPFIGLVFPSSRAQKDCLMNDYRHNVSLLLFSTCNNQIYERKSLLFSLDMEVIFHTHAGMTLYLTAP